MSLSRFHDQVTQCRSQAFALSSKFKHDCLLHTLLAAEVFLFFFQNVPWF